MPGSTDPLTPDDVDWSDQPDMIWEPAAWPHDGTDPFEPAPGLQWVASTNHVVGRAFPAGDWRDWSSWKTDFEKHLRMGYTALYGSERLAVCHDGVVVDEQPASGDEAFVAVFVVPGKGKYWWARRNSWATYDEARADAVRFSRHGRRRAIVLRHLRSVGWH